MSVCQTDLVIYLVSYLFITSINLHCIAYGTI